jgi:hypothetical protein
MSEDPVRRYCISLAAETMKGFHHTQVVAAATAFADFVNGVKAEEETHDASADLNVKEG